jgi:hypothetical protein
MKVSSLMQLPLEMLLLVNKSGQLENRVSNGVRAKLKEQEIARAGGRADARADQSAGKKKR